MTELSKKDRLLLINQYKILRVLEPESADHYDELISILENGFKIFYSMLEESISEDISEDECRLVLDILSIYRFIEDYKYCHPEDNEIIKHGNSIFRGFDGNHETNMLVFARFLIDMQGKFSEQIKNKNQISNFNSPECKVKEYENVIKIWKSEFEGKPLCKREEILRILEAFTNEH
ncbi:MAG: hypothetical protein CVV64_18805 [Candidatus Wallbacteria bacterium HGW-Wallbacteria-1]|uniref:YfbU family protein n=1 Tax=Candidatus Wallbacteria bacterium HGW-Wallbacteria-1 TaxID=2013854 RepID=A0A2N1PJE5_9BACT|nr:MAG: hypothetical protein CVV64_18805 [Candidatus Wallbacteria bacterium HGW-Wallbacteria-1]